MKLKDLADLLSKSGRCRRDDAGAAAVEFALVLPVLMLILFGTIEMGRAFNVRQTLTDAAREGARLAAVGNGVITPTSKLQDSVSVVVRGSAARAGLNLTQLTIDPTGVGAGTGNPVRVDVVYQYDPLFGKWVFSDDFLRIRASSVMRNE